MDVLDFKEEVKGGGRPSIGGKKPNHGKDGAAGDKIAPKKKKKPKKSQD